MITELSAQLAYVPSVRRPLASIPDTLVIGGMGGSALAGEALRFLAPDRTVLIHRDYGLPSGAPVDALYIALSYSGNTEETLAFANAAIKEGRMLAVVSSGGTLAAFAEREGLPYAEVPAGFVPRNAFMYMVRALLALTAREAEGAALAAVIMPEAELEEDADMDAHFLLQSVPLFYTSDRNRLIGSMAKLILNEAARMPAFANVFPELNHNEMQSFDRDMPEGLEDLFRFVLVKDAADHPRIARRMDVFSDLAKERGRFVRPIEIGERSRAETLAMLWIRFLLAGRKLAQTRGIDPDTQPLIDQFKKLL
jgi:glucose/mannose-6-phosphate isomerase